MPRNPEFSGQGIPRKEVPPFSMIERICHGIEVVQMEEGERKYHVTWERDVGETHVFFSSLQQVLNSHERVLERFLGTQIPRVAGQFLTIPGESQRVAHLSARLTTLGGKYLGLLKAGEPGDFQEEISQIIRQIGQATNEHKVKAQENLRAALLSSEKAKQEDQILAANLAILERGRESLLIVRGTLVRLRIVAHRREIWEGVIERSFGELVEELLRLEKGDLNTESKEQIARHIAGKRYGIFVRLNGINGPEYWRRIQTREIQNLARFEKFLLGDGEERAKRILAQAILKLERVVKEREERLKGTRREK